MYPKYFDGNFKGIVCGFESKKVCSIGFVFFWIYHKSLSLQFKDGVPFYNLTSKRSRTLNISECRLKANSEMKKKIHPSIFCTFVDEKNGLVYDDSGSLFLIDNHLDEIA